MAIEKRVWIDSINVVNNMNVELRQVTQFFEDGEAASDKSYHRKVITPGMDYSEEPEHIRRVCEIFHTEEAIEEYRALENARSETGLS
jgi:hypothetical protein